MDSSPAQRAQTYLDLQEDKAFLMCLSPWFVHEYSSLLCAMGILSQDSFGDIWRSQQMQTGVPTTGLLRRGPQPWPAWLVFKRGLQNFPKLFARDPPL